MLIIIIWINIFIINKRWWPGETILQYNLFDLQFINKNLKKIIFLRVWYMFYTQDRILNYYKI